jgi:single-strand DNA-binding protein
MALLSGIFRIGRDPEMRYLPNGDGVLTLAVVYNYGKKGEDGNRPSQWLDCALFGKRAESLQPYLTKGSQVSLVIQDPHNETYKTKNLRH